MRTLLSLFALLLPVFAIASAQVGWALPTITMLVIELLVGGAHPTKTSLTLTFFTKEKTLQGKLF